VRRGLRLAEVVLEPLLDHGTPESPLFPDFRAWQLADLRPPVDRLALQLQKTRQLFDRQDFIVKN
jgi:hypothetical protein